MKRIVSCK
ncbi:hypothetical protein LINPERPRIM_LOCUS13583 [Linum perenne]